MKKYLLTLLSFTFCSLIAFGQNKSIRGTVVSSADNQPIIGASVKVKGTTMGTITDMEGGFNIDAPSNAVLVVSYISYETVEIAVNDQSVINVSLNEDVKALSTVVVVGYGTQRKADLTSAISTLNPQEVLKAPGDIKSALQGTIAGVNVSGDKIRIRGTSTITGTTDPLWVVDGIIDASVPNEDEIETIQVLKDAASSAIYGVRGANGVIVVTTKKGKSGKPTVNFNAYAGTGSLAKRIHMMNAYDFGVYVNELYYMAASDAAREDGSWKVNVPSAYASPSNPMADTDWWKEYFCRSNYQKYDLSISGANESFNYRLGTTYSYDSNELKTWRPRRQNAYANIQGTTGRFTYGGRLQLDYNKTKSVPTPGINQLLRIPSTLPVYDDNGELYNTGDYAAHGNDLANIAWHVKNQKKEERSYSGLAHIFGELKIFDWLKYRISYTHNFGRGDWQELRPARNMLNNVQPYTDTNIEKNGNNRTLFENLISLDKTFTGGHNVSGVLGVTSERYERYSTNVYGKSYEWHDFGVESKFPTDQNINSSRTDNSYYSYLARIMYSYNSKYMFTANFRADKTSKFAPGKRWGHFPSFSAGWRISEEPFLKDATSNWLDNLKLRATLGWIGSAGGVGEYDYQALVNTDNRYYTLGSNQSSPNASDSNAPAPLPESIANRDLTWETTRDAGFGLDMDLLNNKLSFTFDYYNRKVSDMLLEVQLPLSVGTVNSLPMNIGSMTNWGLEFSVTYRDKIGDVGFSVSPNASLYRNKVTSLGTYDFLAGGNTSNGYVTRTVSGQPVSQFWGYKTAGLFKTDEEAAGYVNSKGERYQAAAKAGDLKYVDVNGDGVINDEDKAFLGSSIPDVSVGLNIQVDYKGFDFSMLFQGDLGYEIYNNYKSTFMAGKAVHNQKDDMVKRFRAKDITFTTPGGETITLPANTKSSIPRIAWGDPNGNSTRPSDYFVEDGSYIRCNRITLGYTIPKSFLQKFQLEHLRIYAGIKNPFTITDYSMFDPQVPGDGNTLTRGVDNAYYWNTPFWSSREFFGGLQLTF